MEKNETVVGGFEDCMEALGEKAARKGKNARSTVSVDGYGFDSNEEADFYEWVKEAKGLGFVESFTYQPPSFVLFPGLKDARGKHLVREHVYTADFKIDFSDAWVGFRRARGMKVFDKFDEREVYVDVKGGYGRFGGDRCFSVNQKWTFSKFGVYVWKVKPLEFFKRTWVPEACRLTRKTGKVRARYASLSPYRELTGS